jgi:hypothetical protein
MTHYTFPSDIDIFLTGYLKNGDGIFINEDGSVGINTTDPVALFNINGELNIATLNQPFPTAFALEVGLSGENSTGIKFAEAMEIVFISEATSKDAGYNDVFNTFHYMENKGNARNLYGTLNIVTNNSLELCNRAIGINGTVINIGGGTLTNAYGLYFGVECQNLNSEITNAYGCYIFSDVSLGAVIDTCYGLFIDALAGNSKWGIYVNDSAPNYFAGKVGLGVENPAAKLDINGSVNLAPGNTYNINGSPHTHGELIALAVALG